MLNAVYLPQPCREYEERNRLSDVLAETINECITSFPEDIFKEIASRLGEVSSGIPGFGKMRVVAQPPRPGVPQKAPQSSRPGSAVSGSSGTSSSVGAAEDQPPQRVELLFDIRGELVRVHEFEVELQGAERRLDRNGAKGLMKNHANFVEGGSLFSRAEVVDHLMTAHKKAREEAVAYWREEMEVGGFGGGAGSFSEFGGCWVVVRDECSIGCVGKVRLTKVVRSNSGMEMIPVPHF